ncbi:MAG: nuclear transport factor 2 family protein [Cyanobacteria bacterium CRU_2_1]|nr:nuclear transport factor 2 family protein [Cyanobacteria bacterium CRU_2_1]
MSIIQTLEDSLRQAMLTSDVAMLDKLIGNDLVFTMHTGSVINKQDDLEAHRSGKSTFRDGLNYLCRILLNLELFTDGFLHIFQLLSCT